MLLPLVLEAALPWLADWSVVVVCWSGCCAVLWAPVLDDPAVEFCAEGVVLCDEGFAVLLCCATDIPAASRKMDVPYNNFVMCYSLIRVLPVGLPCLLSPARRGDQPYRV
jgi:hypothetical protein